MTDKKAEVTVRYTTEWSATVDEPVSPASVRLARIELGTRGGRSAQLLRMTYKQYMHLREEVYGGNPPQELLSSPMSEMRYQGLFIAFDETLSSPGWEVLAFERVREEL